MPVRRGHQCGKPGGKRHALTAAQSQHRGHARVDLAAAQPPVEQIEADRGRAIQFRQLAAAVGQPGLAGAQPLGLPHQPGPGLGKPDQAEDLRGQQLQPVPFRGAQPCRARRGADQEQHPGTTAAILDHRRFGQKAHRNARCRQRRAQPLGTGIEIGDPADAVGAQIGVRHRGHMVGQCAGARDQDMAALGRRRGKCRTVRAAQLGGETDNRFKIGGRQRRGRKGQPAVTRR